MLTDEELQEFMPALRVKSRQEYLGKRELQQLELLRRIIAEEEYLFAGEKLTEKERRQHEKNKALLALAEQSKHVILVVVIVVLCLCLFAVAVIRSFIVHVVWLWCVGIAKVQEVSGYQIPEAKAMTPEGKVRLLIHSVLHCVVFIFIFALYCIVL